MMINLPNRRFQSAATPGVAGVSGVSGLLLTRPFAQLGLADFSSRFALSDFPVALFVLLWVFAASFSSCALLVARIARGGQIKACAFSFALALVVPASADICIVAPVTVGQLQGQVRYCSTRLGREVIGKSVSIEIRRLDSDRSLVAATRTDEEGKFSFGKVPPGKYELRLYSHAASLSVEVEVVQPRIFRWFPANWLEIGMGLVQPEGCPLSYVRAKRLNR